MKTLRIIISGTVQGKLYVKYIEEEAKKMGVRGFVRNTPEGDVEAVFEGLDDRVMQMLEIAKAGTPHAKIRDVVVRQINHQGFSGFSIMRI